MNDLNFVLLYVENPTKSAEFYSKLLDKQPVEASPGFVLFVFPGMKLGLWQKSEVEPLADAPAGAAELCFAEKDVSAVQKTYEDWKSRGLPIAQKPVQMDFGFTFVVLDPDGHRIRVFSPPEV